MDTKGVRKRRVYGDKLSCSRGTQLSEARTQNSSETETRYVVQLFTQLQTAAGARDVLYSNASLKAKIQPNLYMYLSTRYSYRYSV